MCPSTSGQLVAGLLLMRQNHCLDLFSCLKGEKDDVRQAQMLTKSISFYFFLLWTKVFSIKGAKQRRKKKPELFALFSLLHIH